MADGEDRVTVYYDGTCPLCRAEIGHYRSIDEQNRLCFIDASAEASPLGSDLERKEALARFHVRDESGRLLSGAAAFVRVWETLPRWRWAARMARVPGVLWLLEIGYRVSLVVRPRIARFSVKRR